MHGECAVPPEPCMEQLDYPASLASALHGSASSSGPASGLQDAVRHVEQAPFIQLYLPGQGTDAIHRHRVTEDFVQAPQVGLEPLLCPLQSLGPA